MIILKYLCTCLTYINCNIKRTKNTNSILKIMYAYIRDFEKRKKIKNRCINFLIIACPICVFFLIYMFCPKICILDVCRV